MLEELRIADCGLWNAERRRADRVVREIADMGPAKSRHYFFDVIVRNRFIKRNSDGVLTEQAEIVTDAVGALQKIGAGGVTEFNPNSVEEVFMRYLETKLAQTFCEFSGEIVDTLRDRSQSLRS